MTVSSRALPAQGPLVVTFYRGVWYPYCNLNLRALEEIRPEIEARGARLIAISPRRPRTVSSCSTRAIWVFQSSAMQAWP
ncbi:redoxin domain-containing protein [Pseudomonas sp. NFR16]|uniref:redoxin domain-containing protein n=1 Tax=Pseudomonas sp. NFR16 TaxID=1566248 RepID=UPI003527CE43